MREAATGQFLVDDMGEKGSMLACAQSEAKEMVLVGAMTETWAFL